MSFNLDFSQRRDTDRVSQVEDVLSENPNLTPTELEFLSNFILWGQDENGETPSSRKEILLTPSKFRKPKPEISLDQLVESTDSYVELFILDPSIPRLKSQNEVFSRDLISRTAPPHLQAEFNSLFSRIDSLTSTLETNPPTSRTELLALKRELLTLRKAQFSLRDEFLPRIQRKFAHPYTPENPLTLETYPLPPFLPNSPIYLPLTSLSPHLPTPTLSRISSLYSLHTSNPPPHSPLDLTSTSTLHPIFENFLSLYFSEEDSTQLLLSTLYYYLDNSPLSPLQIETLFLRITGLTNKEIVSYINSKYSKTFYPNYISTIYYNQVLPTLSKLVSLHHEIITSLPDPSRFKTSLLEESDFRKSPTYLESLSHFKTCRSCRKTLLRSPHFFTKRSSSPDKLASNCRACAKRARTATTFYTPSKT